MEDLIKIVNMLISENKFDEAKDVLEKNKNKYKYKLLFKLLKQKLEEESIIYNIEINGLKDRCNEFISLGNLNFRFSDFYVAYQYYMAGAYLTNLPYFYYKAAKALYFCDDYKKAVELFEKYTNIGYSKLDKAYYFLSNCKIRMNLPNERTKILNLKRKVYKTIYFSGLNEK